MTRVAAIDCGTNSLRLLVADVDPDQAALTDVDRRMEIVRLGAGVDATGRIAPEALERTLAVTRTYAALCDGLGVERLRFVATSATRDASNRNEFVAGVRALLGVEPEVIPGEEEARLSFVGATRGLVVEGADGARRQGAGTDDAPAQVGDAQGGVLVVDIGGGSTEVVLGRGGRVEASASVDIGCVRLTERHLASDPPSPEQILAVVRDVDTALDHVAAVVPLGRAGCLIGLAGSVTTVTAHVLGLAKYDSSRIHGARVPVAAAIGSCDALLHLTRSQRAALPYMHPGRVDVIGAGAVVWRQVLQRVAAATGLSDVMTSEHDILDGIAWSLA